MALVPLKELLVKHGISRQTYHRLLNAGLLPHYAKKFGEPGKRGCKYLYDSDIFDAAFLKHVGSKKRGLGINKEEDQKRRETLIKMSKPEQVSFILENVPPADGESLMEYDARIQKERVALLETSDAEILLRVDELFRQGLKPLSMR